MRSEKNHIVETVGQGSSTRSGGVQNCFGQLEGATNVDPRLKNKKSSKKRFSEVNSPTNRSNCSLLFRVTIPCQLVRYFSKKNERFVGELTSKTGF